MMVRKIMCLLLCALTALMPLTAGASEVDEAEALYNMGLLKGTGESFSEESMELDRNATRAEICVSIVRMLGKEEKANYQQNAHPFSDVPAWAGNYIGWLYENYLVNGVSDTYFGANDEATVKQFAAMLLRVLNYDDSAGDFSYDNAIAAARNVGILEEEIADGALSRRQMIHMCYNALKSRLNNSSRTLIFKLCDEKAVDKTLAEENGFTVTGRGF